MEKIKNCNIKTPFKSFYSGTKNKEAFEDLVK